MSIQIAHAFDRLDLRQNRIDGLIVTRDRNSLAAPSMFAIAYGYDNNLRFSSATARNPKRFSQWPDFFPCLDGKHDRINRMDKMVSEQTRAPILIIRFI